MEHRETFLKKVSKIKHHAIKEQIQKQVEKIERPRVKGHNFAFSGLARCGECKAAITSEQHIKKYKIRMHLNIIRSFISK